MHTCILSDSVVQSCFEAGLLARPGMSLCRPPSQHTHTPGGTLSSTCVRHLKGSPVMPMKRTRPCCFNCCSAGSVSLMIWGGGADTHRAGCRVMGGAGSTASAHACYPAVTVSTAASLLYHVCHTDSEPPPKKTHCLCPSALTWLREANSMSWHWMRSM